MIKKAIGYIFKSIRIKHFLSHRRSRVREGLDVFEIELTRITQELAVQKTLTINKLDIK